MEIAWSEMSLRQADEILDYVEEHFGTFVAQETLDKINSKVDELLLFPEKGTPDFNYTSEVALDNILIRHITVGPNVIYYNVVDDVVNIMVIAHCKQSTQTVIGMIRRYYEGL